MDLRELKARSINCDVDSRMAVVEKTMSQIVTAGVDDISPADRCTLFYCLSRLPIGKVEKLSLLPSAAIKEMYRLRASGSYTFARIASVVLDSLADKKRLFRLGSCSLDNGPAVVFVANMGSQVPTPRPASGSQPTLGYRLRHRRGLVPPFGLYYVASYLAVLGVLTS